MGRKPNWIKTIESSGAIYHERSGLYVWRHGAVNTPRVYRSGEYPHVIDGNKNKWMLHRLVAECFIPNPENKQFVNHIDGNKKNAHVDNLEWVTHSENMLHAYRTGLNKYTPRRKFSRREIFYIRRSEQRFWVLARKYGVSELTIYNIHYLKSYKNIQPYGKTNKSGGGSKRKPS